MKRSALPSIDAYAARVIETGLACAECGHGFLRPHGYKVNCEYCARRKTTAQMAEEGVRVATEKETNREAHAELARQRRTVKEARLERAKNESL